MKLMHFLFPLLFKLPVYWEVWLFLDYGRHQQRGSPLSSLTNCSLISSERLQYKCGSGLAWQKASLSSRKEKLLSAKIALKMGKDYLNVLFFKDWCFQRSMMGLIWNINRLFQSPGRSPIRAIPLLSPGHISGHSSVLVSSFSSSPRPGNECHSPLALFLSTTEHSVVFPFHAI